MEGNTTVLEKDPLYSSAVSQFIPPFASLLRKRLLQVYRRDGNWRAGTIAYTACQIADSYTSLLHTVLGAMGYQGHEPLPDALKEDVRKNAVTLAAMCLILTDLAGVDLLDPEAVKAAACEIKLADDEPEADDGL